MSDKISFITIHLNRFHKVELAEILWVVEDYLPQNDLADDHYPTRMPPWALSSSMRRFLTLVFLKMTSTMVSLSWTCQC